MAKSTTGLEMVFSINNVVNMSSITYDGKKFLLRTKKKQRFVQFCHVIETSAYFLYKLVRLYQLFTRPGAFSFLAFVLHLNFIIAWIVVAILCALQFFKGKEIVYILNQLRKLHLTFSEKMNDVHPSTKAEDSTAKIIKVGMFFACCNVCSNMFCPWYFADHLHFYFSGLPVFLKKITLVKVIMTAYDCAAVACCWLIVLLIIYCILIHSYIIGFWLGRLSKEKCNNDEDLRRCYEIYQTCKLINTFFNDLFAWAVMANLKLGCLLYILTCNFFAIKYIGELPFYIYMAFPAAGAGIGLFLLTSFQIAGNIYDKSTHMKDSVSVAGKIRNKKMKVLELCKPFGIIIGSVYVVKTQTPLHLMQIIIDQSISLLLASA